MSSDEKFVDIVNIEINTNCNLSCSYCPNFYESRPASVEMDVSLFEKIINDLSEIDYRGRVSFDFYNEPTLCSNIIYFVEYTRSKLSENIILLYTNGTRLDYQYFRQLLEAGISNFVITKHEGVKEIVFDNTYNRLTSYERSYIVYKSSDDLVLSNRAGSIKHLKNDVKNFSPCHVPTFLMLITHTGNILPCVDDYKRRMIMGNCKDSKIIDIWNCDKYSDFRKKLRLGTRHLYEACRNCSRTEVFRPGNLKV